MELMVNLHIERLPEGVYLATSDDIQGLVAQGRTLQETLEIARDVARKLLEAQDFEEDFPISQEWMDEIHRRCAAIDNGTDKLVDHDTVMQQLRGKYA